MEPGGPVPISREQHHGQQQEEEQQGKGYELPRVIRERVCYGSCDLIHRGIFVLSLVALRLFSE